MNDEIEILKRRIELKEQLIELTKDEISALLLEIYIIQADTVDTNEQTPN
jgi:hypothetical protein